jgi:hypothetical protein
MPKKINKWIYWTPRTLAILFLLFIFMFSFDVLDSCNNFLSCLIGFFMHNIPVIILATLLYFSWKREIIGTYVFSIAGALYILQMIFNAYGEGGQWYMISYSIIIAGPAFIVAYLFYLNYRSKKK